MPDEVGYIGQLVTCEVAGRLLGESERLILSIAYNEWLRSVEIDGQIRAMEAQQREEEQQSNSNNNGEDVTNTLDSL